MRTKAILRKFADGGGVFEKSILASDYMNGKMITFNKTEGEVIKRIAEWPEVLANAAAAYNPADIAHFVYDLARTYNSFYQENQIVREPDEDLRKLRIALTMKTGQVLNKAMELLGIKMPERM